MKTSVVVLALVLSTAGLFAGCRTRPVAEPRPERLYSVALWQKPVDEPYGIHRVGLPPVVIPSKELPNTSQALLKPNFNLDLQNISLEELANVLSKQTNYEIYTSSLVAGQRISLKLNGSLDEIAEEISAKANIKVTIDHNRSKVWFFSRSSESPRLYNEEVLENEYQSPN